MNAPLPTQPPSSLAELVTAFKDKEAGQDQKGDEQVTPTTTGEESRSEPGTTDSRLDDSPPTKESLLEALTMDDLKAHPKLKTLLQSEVDSAAAKQLQGKTAQITRDVEAKVRQQVELEIASRHFASLTPQELADELATDPAAAKMYGTVSSMPPPPDQDHLNAVVQTYTKILRNYQTQVTNSDLPEDIKAGLNPDLHLMGAGDPDDLISAWAEKVNQAIIDHKVSKYVAENSVKRTAAQELEQQAERDEGDSGGPLITQGTRTAPLPDLMSTPSTVLLADAFARRARQTTNKR